MAASGNIQVRIVSCATASVIWGPRAVRRAERVGWLRRRLATSLESELDCIKLLCGERELADDEPLADMQSDAKEDLELTVLRGGDGAGAAEVLARLRRKGAENTLQGKGGIVIEDDPSSMLTAEEARERMAEIAKSCDVENLPPDVEHWLEVLMTSGQVLKIRRNDGYGMCTENWSAPCFGPESRHLPGILCLSATWPADQAYISRRVYFVDLAGALSVTYGPGAPGAVWVAEWCDSAWNPLEQQLQIAFGPHAIPTLDMIRQMQNGDMQIPGIWVGPGQEMLKCVAPSLSQFFRAASYSGTLPS